MLDIQLDQIKKLINVLEGIDAQYKIILPDGTQFGALEVTKKAERKRKPLYPYGSVRRQFKDIIDNLDVGKAAIIDAAGFDIARMASNITAYTNVKWGAGSIATKSLRSLSKIQVVRLS